MKKCSFINISDNITWSYDNVFSIQFNNHDVLIILYDGYVTRVSHNEYDKIEIEDMTDEDEKI